MKRKTNLQQIDELMELIGVGHKCYGVTTISIRDPYCPRMVRINFIKREALREYLRMIAKHSVIDHISINSNDDTEIVMIIR